MLQLPTLYRFGVYPCYPFLLLVVICVVLNISNDNLYVETVLLKKGSKRTEIKTKRTTTIRGLSADKGFLQASAYHVR